MSKLAVTKRDLVREESMDKSHPVPALNNPLLLMRLFTWICNSGPEDKCGATEDYWAQPQTTNLKAPPLSKSDPMTIF